MFLNVKKSINQNDIKVSVGTEYIIPEGEIKLLGMKMNDSQDWKSQVSGTGGVISSLNQCLFQIRRLRNSLNDNCLKKVADSLVTSKIRLVSNYLAQ